MGRLVIVDIRVRSEYAQVRVPGSIHIPLWQLPRRLGKVRSDRPVALLCGSGHCSGLAARAAAKRRDGVACIKGGMNGWLAAGLPAARCAAPRSDRRIG